jgi:hypothetical protein
VKPALHVQPLGTFVPDELPGHATGWQEPEKNGELFVALMCPRKPALHVQPLGTFVPDEPVGHFAGSQEPEKNGKLSV